MRRLLGVFLPVVFLVSACSIFSDDSGECVGAMCQVDAQTRYCTPENQDRVCGVFDHCDTICEAADIVIAVVNNPLSGSTVQASHIQHAAVEQAISDLAPRFESDWNRQIDVLHLLAGSDVESRNAAFAMASAKGAAVVLTLDSETTLEAQKYFVSDSVLLVGMFTNVGAFAADEAASLRTSFGLIPEPRADFAMWSKFLSETGRCASVAAVYVSANDLTSSEDLRLIELINEYAPQHGIEYLGEVALRPESNFADEVQQLKALDPECVFAFPTVNEKPTNTFGKFLSAFSTTASDGQIQWLFSNQSRLTDLAPHLDDQSKQVLEQGIAVEYAVGGEAGDDLVREFQGYYQVYEAPCFQGQCPTRLDTSTILSNSIYVAIGYDQGVLAALSIYQALQVTTPSRADIRDAFRSINGGASFSLPCSSDDVLKCVDAMAQGARIDYRGASGELNFQPDGRPETIDEMMTFKQVSAFDGDEPTYLVLLRVDHTQMADALRNPSPK